MEIKIASTPEEFESVYKLRYCVYVEEEQKFGGVSFAEKKIRDEFDEKRNTFNLLMLKDGEVIGTVRVTEARSDKERLPSEKLYDFDEIRKNHPGITPASIGMLAVKKSYRDRRTFIELMLSLGKLLLKLKSDYYIFTLNHECQNLIRKTTGATILKEKFWSEEIRNFIIPMILYKRPLLDLIKNAEVRLLSRT